MIEAGVKGFDFETWSGVFAPANISRDLVNRIKASVNKVLTIPEARDIMDEGWDRSRRRHTGSVRQYFSR